MEQEDLHKKWKLVSKRLRKFHQCVVLPVGCLSSGLCRHHAILFKVKNMFPCYCIIWMRLDVSVAVLPNCFRNLRLVIYLFEVI